MRCRPRPHARIADDCGCLRRHLGRIHYDVREYECLQCALRFHTLAEQRAHARVVHHKPQGACIAVANRPLVGDNANSSPGYDVPKLLL